MLWRCSNDALSGHKFLVEQAYIHFYNKGNDIVFVPSFYHPVDINMVMSLLGGLDLIIEVDGGLALRPFSRLGSRLK